jgi:hypothetical protein
MKGPVFRIGDGRQGLMQDRGHGDRGFRYAPFLATPDRGRSHLRAGGVRQELKADAAALRQEFKADAATLRQEMVAELSSMRRDIQQLELRMTVKLGAMMAGAVALTAALVRLL